MESQAAHTHPKNTQVPPTGVVYRRIFVKIFISASGFCCHNKLHKIKSDWITCNFLLWQNSVVEIKIFTKILQYTQSIFSLQCVTQLVTWPEHKELFVASMCYSNMFPQVYPNLWSLESQAQLPLLLTQSCCPPTFSYVWAWAIFQHLARSQALPFFLATLAWTWYGRHPLSSKNLVGTF